MGLDLKYRPRRFSDVLGNDGVKNLLITRSRNGTLGGQSMMFGGPKGCGKTSMARIVAMAMLCESLDDGEPCGSCEACKAVLNETSNSVEELDAASQGTVDKIRDMVHGSQYFSMNGVSDTYILDEAQRLSAAAQDALLKSVEDRSILVILCTTEPHKIRSPIRSRVEEYPVRPPTRDCLVSWMESVCRAEGEAFESDVFPIIADMTEMTPRSCVLKLGTLIEMGGITVDNARSLFRFDSFSLINRILDVVSVSPRDAFLALDDLAAQESPIWIRDGLVRALTSGIRQSVGASPIFPVPITFFEKRNRDGWISLAQRLGRLEKPTVYDIGAALLSDFRGMCAPPVVPSPPPVVPSPPPVVPSPPPVVTPPQQSDVKDSSSSVEIDGISFTSDESLTSLDSKIGAVTDKDQSIDSDSVHVEFRTDRVPMTDKEFARGLIRRIRDK